MRHISNTEAAWVAFAALVPVIMSYLFQAHQARQKAAVRKAVVDKFSSAADFAAFAQTPAGQTFIAELAGLESPLRAVLGAIQRGIVLSLVGGGLWWVGTFLEEAAEIAGVGILLVCVGVSTLISAAISYRLSKSWGLIGKP